MDEKTIQVKITPADPKDVVATLAALSGLDIWRNAENIWVRGGSIRWAINGSSPQDACFEMTTALTRLPEVSGFAIVMGERAW